MEEKIEMLTIKEVAERTGLTQNAVRRYVLDGKIPHRKAGIKYLLNWDKVKEFLEGTEELENEENVEEYGRLRKVKA